MRVTFTLAGKPVGKQRPRVGVVQTAAGRAFGHLYTPKETRVQEAALRYEAQRAMAGRAPIEGACVVLIVQVFRPPASWSKRKTAEAIAGVLRPEVKPDWDNIAKTTDALNEIVFADDKQIVDGRVVKWYGPEPYMEVTVSDEPADLAP